jgi:predicted DNA-binding transcriptional regulator YafY
LLINLIKKDNKITIAEMAAIFWVTMRTVKRNIRNLKENGINIRMSSDKGGYWIVIKKNEY